MAKIYVGPTCQKCNTKSKWIGGMLWTCRKSHRFIVDSSRPVGTPHTFL